MAPSLVVDDRPYTLTDARKTVASLGPWWDQLAADRRVPPGFDRLLAAQTALLAAAVGVPCPVGSMLCRVESVRAIDELAVNLFRTKPDATTLEPVLGPSLRLLAQAGPLLRAAGALPETAAGSVLQLNRSDGGVPKLSVAEVEVGFGGVVGDRQAHREHHGRPWQALCLWAKEVTDGFVAAGHTNLGYGCAGENVTVAGLPWAQVRAGTRLRLGEVLAEVSVFALPCTSNAKWFAGGNFALMHHDRGPVSRVYASVVEPGRIRQGDPAILEPPTPS